MKTASYERVKTLHKIKDEIINAPLSKEIHCSLLTVKVLL
jgi:hypothetical protein